MMMMLAEVDVICIIYKKKEKEKKRHITNSINEKN